MKHKFLLKAMLLLCALIAGSSSSWATEEVFTFNTDAGLSALGITKPNKGAGTDLGSGTYSSGDVTLSATNGSTNTRVWNSNGTLDLRIYSGGTLVIEAPGNITSIVLAGSAVGVFSCGDVGSFSSGTWTGNPSGNITSVTLSATGTGKINTITVTYTPAEKIDPTITFNNSSIKAGKTLDLSTLLTSNSAGAVTYSITEGGSYASISGNILTGTAAGSVTVQASQAAAGIYNAKTATATITVTDPALSSITITTAPTKTTYEAGEVFDATGMVVTATFADTSEEDVTASCTWAPSGALNTSDVEVTVSYTHNAVTKTATQAITVNAYEQPLSVTIDMNYTWLGSSNGSNLAKANLPVVKSDDHVTTTITEGSSNQPRGDADYIRVYQGSTITFAAPVGYCIKSLVFTTGGNNSWTAPKISAGSLSSKTWTGKAPSVTFYLSGSCFIASVAVTLEAATAINIDITSANWASFSSAYEVEIPTGVTAYYAQQKDAENVTLKEITGGYIPANTGVVVYSATAKTYTANITTTGATLGETNILKPWVTAGTPSDATYYTLAAGPKFKKSSGGILAAGKAYLVMPAAAAPELGVDFGSETTGISAINDSELKVNGEFYNLAGQRVAQPTKGLYIVNGKKVVIK